MVQSAGRVTLWGVEAFAATADEGAVSAAAKRLGASPSAISQQIAGLETALGVQLMDRTTRPVTLTPAGKIFLRRARKILTEAQLAKAELAGNDLSALTDFRLGVIEDFDADVTPRLLAQMAGDLQTCQFLLETGASHRLIDQLDARALDVVVTADTATPPSWMEVHPLLEEPFIAATPDGFDSAEAAMAELPLIQYSARHVMGRQILAHLERHNLAPPHRFELDSYHAILAMVAAGLGWAILTPLGYLRAHRFRGATRAHPLPFAPLSRQISLNARQGVLGEMPAQMAGRLRPILDEMIVAPATHDMPWLKGRLKLL
ncbi:LysR family transcriptional regulator [Actibacterium mucosum KCTC 23349]|uniref:LysR family transcriptional regulator n=1 Tax=Actibacterium mucosum KCTC 23349 TaxID=1454373 RepID=A0A037ZH62_9RHOB|nr:LysR family transcriptional regulator [Actibacterium mucosum]KAJ54160.1 LysR family transcriptional regulator [Actibacterium mucosum KCTC 23349]